MKNDFLIAITQVCAERHLSKEVVLEAVEQALVLAYKRNFGASQAIEVKIDPNTGQAHVFAEKEVVEEVREPHTEVSLEEARQIDTMAQLGNLIKVELTPKNFGRITAQTAKQVILQRIREAERDTLYADWSDRLGEDIMGTVRNIDSSGNVILSLGRAEAIMPKSEQIPTEQYTPNQRLRTYIYEVERSARGPRILVSRTHHKLLRRLLEAEVPEIYNGTVEIKAIAREPGSRSKVAVCALQAGVDPVGSCVGLRGTRIQTVVNELNGEKIDVVAWSPDEATFIAGALSPARVEHVWLARDSKTATVVVPDIQLSLAIGKQGQNARLSAKLTGWRIDIKNVTEAAEEAVRRAAEQAEAKAKEAELAAKRAAAATLLAEAEALVAQEEQIEAAMAEAAPAAAETPTVEQSGAAEAAEVVQAAPAEVLEAPASEAVPAVAAPAEAPASVEEQPVPVLPEIPPVAFEPAEEEEEGDDKTKGKGKKKRRQQDLVLDEKTGSLVRPTPRKQSRRGNEWEEEGGEW